MVSRSWNVLLALTLAATLTLGVSIASADDEEERAIPSGPTIGLELVATGFTSPLSVVEPPDGSGRLFVVDQIGLIRIITPDGTLLAEPFLDLRSRMVPVGPGFTERGLLGFVFHPDFADNDRLFVYYSAPRRPEAPGNWNHTSHIAEYSVSASDPNSADFDSERILLQVDQPQSNHNAGDIHFGPDGYLYIALGDGGGSNDTGLGHTPNLGNGQDATNLLGSLLRIDVDGAEPYEVPDDNPFIGTIARDEIFAYGLRNPYRFTFDGDDLYLADVGQVLWEEVNLVDMGGNYGWNVKEATHCFDPANPSVSPETCPDVGPLFGDPLIDPVIEYRRAAPPVGVGIAVIGGRVYRGSALPQLAGRYVFGDWSTSFGQPNGTLMVARPRPQGLWHIQELQVYGRPDGRLGEFVVGFGQDADGEVYVGTSDTGGASGTNGNIYRLTKPGD